MVFLWQWNKNKINKPFIVLNLHLIKEYELYRNLKEILSFSTVPIV